MITEKNHKLLPSQLFVTDCTKKGLASMHSDVYMSCCAHCARHSDVYISCCAHCARHGDVYISFCAYYARHSDVYISCCAHCARHGDVEGLKVKMVMWRV
jgi:hypothetical protein